MLNSRTRLYCYLTLSSQTCSLSLEIQLKGLHQCIASFAGLVFIKVTLIKHGFTQLNQETLHKKRVLNFHKTLLLPCRPTCNEVEE